jgi:lysophospholipase L1-like esterase
MTEGVSQTPLRRLAPCLKLPDEIFEKAPPLEADMPELLGAQHEDGENGLRWRLLTYGCSLTAQYSHYLREQFNPDIGLDVWMCGLCGRTAAELVRMADQPTIEDEACRVGKGLHHILARDEPFQIIVIMAGTNDLGMGYPPGDVVRNVISLHRMCHTHGIRTVALSLPPNIASETNSTYQEKWLEVNKNLREWAYSDDAKGQVALFVETSEVVPFESEMSFYSIDGLHFSDVGCERVASCLKSFLTPIILESTSEIGFSKSLQT